MNNYWLQACKRCNSTVYVTGCLVILVMTTLFLSILLCSVSILSAALKALKHVLYWKHDLMWIRCLLLSTTHRGRYYRQARVLKCPDLPLDPLSHHTHTHTRSHVLLFTGLFMHQNCQYHILHLKAETLCHCLLPVCHWLYFFFFFKYRSNI